MIFNSIEFIFLFLPAAVVLYYLTPVKARNLMMLLLSGIFFSWGNPRYLGLMAICVLLNYSLTLLMDQILVMPARQLVLTAIVTFNLLILFVFKYLGFFFTTFNAAAGTSFYAEKLAQPLGLSFYTFQVLSYNIDVYTKKIPAEKNPVRIALYLLMFPQLASGPIMRFEEIAPQLKDRLVRPAQMADGAERFLLGLFKKVFIANTLSALWNIMKTADPAGLSALSAWVGIIAFSLYIYFDFSGYMDMAIGIAWLFGFQLKENFDFPYVARSIAEFWRRWHMTLGAWFRDYIYIPLGGSRQGVKRLILASTAVWLTTGLWHGASWNFVAWGAYYGIILLLERFFLKKLLSALPGGVANIWTLFLVIIGWVIFDTRSLGHAAAYLGAMAGVFGWTDQTGIYYLYTYLPILILGIVLSRPAVFVHFGKLRRHMTPARGGAFLLGLGFLFVVSVAYLLNQSFSPSMYIGF